jgi:endonuclease G
VDLYARNELDRGHLVRRLDPVWGDTLDAARLADIDTFHLTNCSPQHAGFNRNKTLWAGLEDYVLKNTDVHDLRVSVFTGPIFDPADPIYRGVRLPRSFWKVVAMVRSTGEMSATGYLLSQAGLLPDLRAFDFGRYGTFQVRVAHIAELSRLRFGRLPRHDPLARVTSGVRGLSAVRLLEEPGQILL